MAGSLNKVLLIGRLGADPEIRRTLDGRPVATLRLATNERWKDKATGEQKEKVEWHRIVIFNEQLCDVAERYLKKGALVFVEGQLGTRKWIDTTGVERWSTEIVLSAFRSSLTMLEGRGDHAPAAEGEADYGTPAARGSAATARDRGAASGGRGDDDEIPF